MPALPMAAARAETARPIPTEAASADVPAAARPASPFCPADPSALIRPRSASEMACWTMVPAMTWVAARHSDALARRTRTNEGPAANAAIPALAPANAMPMVTAPRRTPSGSRACWSGGGPGFRVDPSDGGSQSTSSEGRNCLVEWIKIAYYKWSKL
jgi:hypothetical protein